MQIPTTKHNTHENTPGFRINAANKHRQGPEWKPKLQEEVSAEIARDKPATGEAAPAPPTVEPPPQDEAPSKPSNEEGSLRSSLVGMIGMIQGVFGQIKGVALNTTQMFIVLVTVFFGVTFTLMNPRPIFGALFSVVPERLPRNRA